MHHFLGLCRILPVQTPVCTVCARLERCPLCRSIAFRRVGLFQQAETSKFHFRHQRLFLCLWVFFACAFSCTAEKFRYTTLTECDRYSLDALYNEKFKIITDNVFKDTIEFVKRVSDSISESLTSIMAELPNRAASSNQEEKIFNQFKAVKNTFTSRAKKLNARIILSWESLLTGHFDLMYDSGNCSLAHYVNITKNMTDEYVESRKALDASMESFVGVIKGTVRDGLQGISSAAANALKKDKKENTTGDKIKEGSESEEEKLTKKKLEIAEMVVQGFLGKVTIEVIKRNIDLFKKVDTTPEGRDSVLDDLEFDILMIRHRILVFTDLDFPNDKGSVDLARRSIYTYWGDLAAEMYKEKIKSKNATTPAGDMYYRKLWSDETVLMNTLLSLMEVYS